MTDLWVDGRLAGLAERYLDAKEFVIAAGHAAEIDWQEDRDLSDVGDAEFLAEAAWVILSAGLSERAVRKRFPALARAFHFWDPAGIVGDAAGSRSRALSAFRHERKVDAIIAIARHVSDQGIAVITEGIARDPVTYLSPFAYLGPATSLHLAKNLGIDVAKPDRHLVRVARATGFGSPMALCECLAWLLAERVAVVDIVIWRFATLRSDYVAHFSEGLPAPTR